MYLVYVGMYIYYETEYKYKSISNFVKISINVYKAVENNHYLNDKLV